jgi:hypothetical protein
MVPGEIPDREAALAELFRALKSWGVLSITEVIFDPHFQTRASVLRMSQAIGFKRMALHGHALADCLNLQKPQARREKA